MFRDKVSTPTLLNWPPVRVRAHSCPSRTPPVSGTQRFVVDGKLRFKALGATGVDGQPGLPTLSSAARYHCERRRSVSQPSFVSAPSLNRPGFKAQMGKPRLRKLEDQILRGATLWMFGLGERAIDWLGGARAHF